MKSCSRNRNALLRYGANWTPGQTTFALTSLHGTSVELCLYDDARVESDRVPMESRGDGEWSVKVAGDLLGHRYGYRIDGPYDPQNGHRFNSAKLLLDPYALAVSGRFRWTDSLRGFQHDPYHRDNRSRSDSALSVALSVVADRRFEWDNVGKPDRSIQDTIIYESHVKGMTKLHPEVEPALRGTYAGMASAPVIEHLQALGITAIELLPCQSWIDEEALVRSGLVNYWGYNPIAFLAPEARYSHLGDRGGQITSFKSMVKELHRAGIEVLLDIVLNHSGEGNEYGPTIGLRGIDNRDYYLSQDGNHGAVLNVTGTGNSIAASTTPGAALLLDALRYWAVDMQVDGFRFDLATTIGRNPVDFDANADIFQQIAADPELSRCKLIAEPWDVGPGGYQLGNFPSIWREWNDRYRDAARSFWLGHPLQSGEFAARVSGSSDLFKGGKEAPASVNFVVAHDGFTLHDLVSYMHKANEANQQHNRDGASHNLSANFGIEGVTDDPRVLDRRFQAKRNLIATVLGSRGVPMLLGGDEIGRNQLGNNNAYCQDNEISWWHWDLSERDRTFGEFVGNAIAARRRLNGLQSDGAVHWHFSDGRTPDENDWNQEGPRALAAIFDASSAGIDGGGECGSVLVMFNATHHAVDFLVPATRCENACRWRALLDTSVDDGLTEATYEAGNSAHVVAHSMIIAVETTC